MLLARLVLEVIHVVLSVWLFTYLLNNSLADGRDAGSVVGEVMDVSNLKQFYSW